MMSFNITYDPIIVKAQLLNTRVCIVACILGGQCVYECVCMYGGIIILGILLTNSTRFRDNVYQKSSHRSEKYGRKRNRGKTKLMPIYIILYKKDRSLAMMPETHPISAKHATLRTFLL